MKKMKKKKLLGVIESHTDHGAHSRGRYLTHYVYDDGTFEAREGPAPKGALVLSFYERAVTGQSSGVTFGEFLEGYLPRWAWRREEIVRAAQQFWAARNRL